MTHEVSDWERQGWEEDEDLSNGEADIEEYECTCSLCFCLNKSAVPGVCSDCCSHAHQG